MAGGWREDGREGVTSSVDSGWNQQDPIPPPMLDSWAFSSLHQQLPGADSRNPTAKSWTLLGVRKRMSRGFSVPTGYRGGRCGIAVSLGPGKHKIGLPPRSQFSVSFILPDNLHHHIFWSLIDSRPTELAG